MLPKLRGIDATRQKDIDYLLFKLDGTENKSKLGGNAVLGISLAVCKAAANASIILLYGGNVNDLVVCVVLWVLYDLFVI